MTSTFVQNRQLEQNDVPKSRLGRHNTMTATNCTALLTFGFRSFPILRTAIAKRGRLVLSIYFDGGVALVDPRHVFLALAPTFSPLALDTGSRRRQEIAVVYLCFESILNSTIQAPGVVRRCPDSNIIDIVSDAIDLSQDLSENFLA